MDPQKTKGGKPYGPERFKQLVKERYLITKHTNTSYGDTGDISIKEKDMLIDFIMDDLKRTKEAIEESEAKVKESRKGHRR